MLYHSRITQWEQDTGYYFPKVEIKDYHFLDQPVKNDIRTNKKIRKNATDQGDVYTTSCLMDYPYFK